MARNRRPIQQHESGEKEPCAECRAELALLQRAMAKQAEAERERRAKVINAEGEFQAAAKLGEAAEVLTRFPVAVQLRYLQTMREIASERNTTTFFPLPMDLLGLFQTMRGKDGGETK